MPSGLYSRSLPSVYLTGLLVRSIRHNLKAIFGANSPVDDHVLMALPSLYRYGREGKYFGEKLFLVFMSEGVVQVSRESYS